jgi:hypothetical protein
LFDEYGGAAAAYSLRRLGSAYSGPLVRVRRDSDDAELDFTSTTQIADWVNGKQETTLPADVATASAAYSLRKVKDTYTGDAVRIRRASDDYEVNVAFDTNGAVSSSSLIEQAELGLNRAGVILFDGVDDDIDANSALLPTSDFTLTIRAFVTSYPSSDATIFGQGTAVGTGRTVLQIQTDGQAFVFLNGVGSFTTANTFNLNEINTIVLSRSGDDYSLTLNGGTAVTNNSSGSPEQVNSQIGDGYSGANFEGSIQSLTVGAVSWDGKQSSAESLGWTVNGSPELSVVVPTTLGEFLTEGGNQDAYVHTWYDQAGSNHATQDTSGDQPKIAEAGALLTRGSGGKATIEFGSSLDYHLNVSGGPSVKSVFSVLEAADTNFETLICDTSDSSPRITSFNAANNRSYVFNGFGTPSINVNGSTYDGTSSVTSFGFHMLGATSATGGNINRIGANPSVSATGNSMDFVSELVLYDSDQSTNRFKIESNINNYYGIYTASHNGFVHTWYDQSGNSNDATQDTLEDEQPTIVSAGSLLADGIDFDGVDDKLNFTALSASDLSIFSVVTFDSVAGQERIIGPQSGANEGFGIGNATTGFFRASGTANGPSLNATISADTTTLYSLIRASNTGTFFTDSTASATFSNTDTFAGASLGGATNPVDGSLKEIIIYTSDQTANRSGIESNIADEYGITLP